MLAISFPKIYIPLRILYEAITSEFLYLLYSHSVLPHEEISASFGGKTKPMNEISEEIISFVLLISYVNKLEC